MLSNLRIRNLALVDDLALELRPGYNVITGETGAGKSVLIGALSLVLGERADRNMIRGGSDNCTVEAVFDVSGLKAPIAAFLEENGLEACEEHQLVLKRAFSNAGTNRQFVNGSPTSLTTLARLGEWLVDIHGPHEHQSLLHPARQLAIVDAFAGLDEQRDGFAALVRRRGELEDAKATLIVDERTYAQQLDLLRFQVNEIEAARLRPEEEQELEAEYGRSSNRAKLLELSQTVLGMLSEDEGSLLTQAGRLGRTLQELQRVDPGAKFIDIHEQAVSMLNDLQSQVSNYADTLDIDPARLQQLEERLNLVHSLKRKYGSSISEILKFGAEAGSKLASLEGRDAELARINDSIQKLDAELLRAGQALCRERRKSLPALSKAVSKQLADLGFKQSRFEVTLTSSLDAAGQGAEKAGSKTADKRAQSGAAGTPKPALTGFDTLEFQFAPNPGEPARPLRAIASSGELARVMLALKTVLAQEDQVPVLVFDEVDANIGGETGNAVGEKMRQIAKNRQVLCITHLPQVAAPASAHFVVTKHAKNGRTQSAIALLSAKERVGELARMLGGQTDAALKHAEALLR